MLKILLPTVMLLPTALLSPQKFLWTNTTAHSLLIATISLHWLLPTYYPHKNLTQWTCTDQISSPLLVLSCWLLPLMILASQNHLQHEPPARKRIFITTLITVQPLLLLAFSATELMLFYITFEATLIPTLVLITRWGSQPERLSAGIYLLFYTLISSLPLLVTILYLHTHIGTLHLTMLKLSHSPLTNSWTDLLLSLALLMAFMVKAPLYGLHLWLPKAHVEAPIAGSMLLAALLLKLGGYGIMRLTLLIGPLSAHLHYPFLTLALWGALMTSSICLRQTDLKSLIAYSSVSHMGLVIAASIIQTHWSFSGAMLLMISHGLTSSMLFCLANTTYERTHSRILLLTRGLHPSYPSYPPDDYQPTSQTQLYHQPPTQWQNQPSQPHYSTDLPPPSSSQGPQPYWLLHTPYSCYSQPNEEHYQPTSHPYKTQTHESTSWWPFTSFPYSSSSLNQKLSQEYP
uniref:NADH-ubiquinone oxidoreductase chain 4 n=1 Tax=Gyps himalayensis TaxID=36248 RepID=A0A343BSH1_9AVES|nr:NADH dehydrogenase subunit 4 [Gyps himalayensis]